MWCAARLPSGGWWERRWLGCGGQIVERRVGCERVADVHYLGDRERGLAAQLVDQVGGGHAQMVGDLLLRDADSPQLEPQIQVVSELVVFHVFTLS